MFIVSALVLFIAGTRWVYVAAMIVAGAALLYAGISMGDSKTARNRLARITAFLHLEDEQRLGVHNDDRSQA